MTRVSNTANSADLIERSALTKSHPNRTIGALGKRAGIDSWAKLETWWLRCESCLVICKVGTELKLNGNGSRIRGYLLQQSSQSCQRCSPSACPLIVLTLVGTRDHWWESLPPTNVSRPRFADPASYVGCVCCRVISSALRCFFLFSKTNISKFQFDPGMYEHF